MSNQADAASSPTELDLTVTGAPADVSEYVRSKIGGLNRYPVTRGRVRLKQRGHADHGCAVTAQANFEVHGRAVRAQVGAGSMREAIDKLEARMRRRLADVCALREPSRGPAAAPPWRHGTDSPTPLPRMSDTARIVRRKSYAMAPCSVDDAVIEMTVLDYRFHLFNEIGSGTAAVVYHGGPTGLRLALVTPDVAGELADFTQLVTISPHPAPCLREDAAIQRLDVLKLPFVFYIDAAQGRASVLYRRLDGDLAMITPAG
ncbi:HPF/RaiA family ribosome-associated protein [Mycolicibacterium neoaurum]|uniref:ribosome hibernation promotion factor n=1 Tax=Mycolicibacterium neoaurum TaxID=1795 RepID=UPI002670E9EB|nr:HPF/RaiA family ribosome-associated protein [Mycolicibacterium neoaurum]MDO3401535.1 HPF/RaiA family ribosome-associated protein [Mycolicibacterium neoaurum]